MSMATSSPARTASASGPLLRNGWAPPLNARFGLFMIGGGGIATSSTK